MNGGGGAAVHRSQSATAASSRLAQSSSSRDSPAPVSPLATHNGHHQPPPAPRPSPPSTIVAGQNGHSTTVNGYRQPTPPGSIPGTSDESLVLVRMRPDAQGRFGFNVKVSAETFFASGQYFEFRFLLSTKHWVNK